jgi:hypothetical protein
MKQGLSPPSEGGLSSLGVREGQISTAILVSGGFHTDGLTQILRQKDVSYVVVTPKITEVPKDNKYLDVFARDQLPLEKLFEGQTIYLSQRLSLADKTTGPPTNGQEREILDGAQKLFQTSDIEEDLGNGYTLLKLPTDPLERMKAIKGKAVVVKAIGENRFFMGIRRTDWHEDILRFMRRGRSQSIPPRNPRTESTRQEAIHWFKALKDTNQLKKFYRWSDWSEEVAIGWFAAFRESTETIDLLNLPRFLAGHENRENTWIRAIGLVLILGGMVGFAYLGLDFTASFDLPMIVGMPLMLVVAITSARVGNVFTHGSFNMALITLSTAARVVGLGSMSNRLASATLTRGKAVRSRLLTALRGMEGGITPKLLAEESGVPLGAIYVYGLAVLVAKENARRVEEEPGRKPLTLRGGVALSGSIQGESADMPEAVSLKLLSTLVGDSRPVNWEARFRGVLGTPKGRTDWAGIAKFLKKQRQSLGAKLDTRQPAQDLEDFIVPTLTGKVTEKMAQTLEALRRNTYRRRLLAAYLLDLAQEQENLPKVLAGIIILHQVGSGLLMEAEGLVKQESGKTFWISQGQDVHLIIQMLSSTGLIDGKTAEQAVEILQPLLSRNSDSLFRRTESLARHRAKGLADAKETSGYIEVDLSDFKSWKEEDRIQRATWLAGVMISRMARKPPRVVVTTFGDVGQLKAALRRAHPDLITDWTESISFLTPQDVTKGKLYNRDGRLDMDVWVKHFGGRTPELIVASEGRVHLGKREKELTKIFKSFEFLTKTIETEIKNLAFILLQA